MEDVGEVSACPFSKPSLCYCKFREVPCRISHMKIMKIIIFQSPKLGSFCKYLPSCHM